MSYLSSASTLLARRYSLKCSPEDNASGLVAPQKRREEERVKPTPPSQEEKVSKERVGSPYSKLINTKTAVRAIGRWPGILQQLGIESRYLSNKHGPCPVCSGKDRFRFDDKGGRGTWICSHCGSGDGFSLLRQVFGWSFKDAATEVDRVVGTVQARKVAQERTDKSKLHALREVWKASRAVSKGDPVWRYLNLRLGLEVVPADLRFHPALPHSEGGTYPAMLAVMRYPDGQAASIHRTYLTEDGHKAPVSEVKKFMSGASLPTSAVCLGSIGQHLGIAEGIETALAASLTFGLPFWAATNAALLESWCPLLRSA